MNGDLKYLNNTKEMRFKQQQISTKIKGTYGYRRSFYQISKRKIKIRKVKKEIQSKHTYNKKMKDEVTRVN